MKCLRAGAITLILIGAACSEENSLSPRVLLVLNQAEARWLARGFADYTYEMRMECFCPPVVGEWVRISVRDGAVVAVRSVDGDSAITGDATVFWSPVDSLFARLRRAGDPDVEDVYSDVVMEFNPQLGYPSHVEWISKPTVQDARVVYWLRNVQPLQ